MNFVLPTVTEIDGMFQRVEFPTFPLHQSMFDFDVFALLQPIGEISHELHFIVEQCFPNAKFHRESQSIGKGVLVQDLFVDRLTIEPDGVVNQCARRLYFRKFHHFLLGADQIHRIAIVTHFIDQEENKRNASDI